MTHWGFLTQSFESQSIESQGNKTPAILRVSATFDCEDDRLFDKLIKALNKQVYVLSVSASGNDATSSEMPAAAQSGMSSPLPILPLYSTTKKEKVSC